MHDYELVYILDPDLAEEAVVALIERFRTLAETQGAEIQNQERWEKRRLAYEIKRKREGTYVVMELHAPAAAVQEMDRLLKITDGILRHMIVRADDAVKAKAKGSVDRLASVPEPPAPVVTAASVDLEAPTTDTGSTGNGAATPETAGAADTPDAADAVAADTQNTVDAPAADDSAGAEDAPDNTEETANV